jgi:hypothetical protein
MKNNVNEKISERIRRAQMPAAQRRADSVRRIVDALEYYDAEVQRDVLRAAILCLHGSDDPEHLREVIEFLRGEPGEGRRARRRYWSRCGGNHDAG